jgi:hypothetical protein
MFTTKHTKITKTGRFVIPAKAGIHSPRTSARIWNEDLRGSFLFGFNAAEVAVRFHVLPDKVWI